MFLVDLPPVPYADPWDLPLQTRIAMLSACKRRVAYFYEEPNNSTFRYRAYNMVEVLNDAENPDLSASYFFLGDWHRIDEVADVADILIICRSRYCSRLNQLVTKFRNRGKRVLFDIDDLVFDTAYTHLIINALGLNIERAETWDFWFAYIGRMGEALRLCDGAITTNQCLADRIVEFSGKPVNVVPNFINREQLSISDAAFEKKRISRFAGDGKIHLGYFSGSPSHRLDYAVVASALEGILKTNPDVHLIIAGYMDQDPVLKKFGNRVSYQPFQDYVNLQRSISRVEFNLMPLQANIFADCKSELKYFDAAVVGTVSIASPSYTYAAAIQHGKNGYLAQAHQWTSVIQQAIDNMSRYGGLAEAAYTDARLKYGWMNQSQKIIQSLGI